METWVKVVAGITGVITLLILIGGAWALVRGSFNQARVKELREDNDDLRKRSQDQQLEIDALKLKEAALEHQISQQQNEIELLTSMLTQRAEVSEVLVELQKHHTEAMNYWSGMSVAMTAILNKLEADRG